VILAACGGHRLGGNSAPSDPEAAVRAFLNAVHANSIAGLRELWGTERGPAARSMGGRELDQRLTVMRTYLAHERFEIVEANAVDPANIAQRVVRVRLMRKGCQQVVPFTLAAWHNGWLVKSVDLAAAGNPARPCPADQSPGT
jgi:hypothetical protein